MMRHRDFIKALLVLCLASGLSACGFTLRGSEQLTASLPNLVLNLQQPAGELSVLLQRRLTAAGTSVVMAGPEADSSAPVLSVGAEQLTSRPVTVNPRARAAQYEVLLSVPISVVHNGGFLIEQDSLSVEKLFFENIETISGNLEEMQVIQAEMRNELVDQILRRLDALELKPRNP